MNIIERDGYLYVKYQLFGKDIEKPSDLKANEANINLLKKQVIPKLLKALHKEQIEYFDYYAKLYLSGKKHLKTYRDINKQVKFILKDLSLKKIGELKSSYIENYFLKMLNDRTPRTIKKYLQHFRAITKMALKDGTISKDPSVDLVLPQHYKKDIEIFKPEEIEIILKETKPIWFRNFIAVFVYTGARPGEIIGLKLENIKDTFIEIRRSIRRGIISTPKTPPSIREIPIFEILKPYLELQIELANEANSEFLFFNPESNSYFKDIEYIRGNIKEGRWVKLLKILKIEYRMIYALRHTFATTMIKNGFSLQVIAQILGHKDIEQVIKTYSKFIKQEHLNINRKIDIYAI